MTNVFVTQIIEAGLFGILWLVLLAISIIWQPRNRKDKRVLRFAIFLHSLAALFVMLATISLLLNNGCLVGCGSAQSPSSKANSEGQWARFIGYTLAGTALYVAVSVYHALEIIPTIIGAVLILISWIASIFTVLNGPSMWNKNAQILWGVVGGFFLLVSTIWICFYSRLHKKPFDWVPIVTYFLGSLLIWVFLWAGPDSSQRIGDTATVVIYVSISALFIIALGITIAWGWGFRVSRQRVPAKGVNSQYPAQAARRRRQAGRY